jgi:CheY-like chemotaxis protein
MTIMYIDDDAEDREFFCEATKHIDNYLMCHMAKDGAEGLRDLREMMVMPDFIFVDVNMPIMNGRQFLVEIKKLPRLRSIPVIMYTTTSHSDEIREYLRLGAYKVLVKPNSLTKIEALVKSVLHDQVSHGEKVLGEVRK